MYRSNEHISHLSDPREGGSRQFDNPVSKSRGSFHEYQFSNHHNQHQPSQDYQTNRFDHNQVTRDNNFNRQNSNYEKQNNERPGSANANNKRIEDVVQPLSTIRLRPIRQKTKNAVANILARNIKASETSSLSVSCCMGESSLNIRIPTSGWIVLW